jgi:type I restriction enzyme, S subunit
MDSVVVEKPVERYKQVKLHTVPENWIWASFGTVMIVPKEKFDPNVNIEKTKYIGLEHLERGVGIVGQGSSDDISSTKNIFKTNDIIYGRLRPYLNKHDIVHFDGICSTDILVFRCKRDLCINIWVNYLMDLDYFIEYAVTNSNGINLPRISEKELARCPIPLPPLQEQLRIINTIEPLFEKLNHAKELIQNALDSFENRKSAILHKAFTGELTAKWRAENGINIDSKWVPNKLKNVCKLSSGGTPSRAIDEYYSGSIPWIKTGEINWNHLYDSEEKITSEALSNSSAKLLPVGTILVAMYGQGLTRGRASILGIEASTNQAVCALIPNNCLINKYLYYFFMLNYWNFREKAVGGNQPNFSQTIIGDFEIAIPTLTEQAEIVRLLDKIFEIEDKARELYDVTDSINLLKKAILARAFRGELGTNNPEEESAVELLRSLSGVQ